MRHQVISLRVTVKSPLTYMIVDTGFRYLLSDQPCAMDYYYYRVN